VHLQQNRFSLIVGKALQSALYRQRQLHRKQSPADFARGRLAIELTFRLPLPQQRKRFIVRDPEQPTRKLRRIIHLRQILIPLQEDVLTKIQRILPISDQPEQIIEDTLFPSGDKKVISLHIAPSRFSDQVAILNLAKDQRLAPLPYS